MQKAEIAQKFFDRMQNYLKSAEFTALQTDNPTVSAQLKELTPDKLIIGDCPKFTEAHFEGNVTGRGHSYCGDTRYERTFCDDFTTGYFLFIGENGLTDKQLCNEAVNLADLGYKQTYFINEKNALVQNEANALVKSELYKLDYRFDSARINNWTLVYDSDEKEIPFYPVYAILDDGKGNIFKTVIGTYSYIGGKETVTTDLRSRIASQPINIYTSISAKAAAAKVAKKKKIAIALGVTVTLLIIFGTTVGTILPNIL